MRNEHDITDALRRHLVNGHRITGVRRLAGGHSNETFLIDGVDQVLRLPPTGVPLLSGRALDVQAQYDLFAVLRGRAGAPPVPRMDYMCRDEAVLGAPFFLMERLDGVAPPDWGPGDWLGGATPAIRSEVSRQFLAAVADLQEVGALDVLGRAFDASAELNRWRFLAADADDPALETLFDDLLATAPMEYDPVVIHGDYKFANTLWKDDRLAAVLDWELAINADPRWGLAYITIQYAGPAGPSLTGLDLPGLWQRDRIIAEWEGMTGLSSRDVSWFEAAICAKSTAMMYRGYELWRSGVSADERFKAWKEVASAFGARGSAYFRHFLSLVKA